MSCCSPYCEALHRKVEVEIMGGRRERRECELEDVIVLFIQPSLRDLRRKTQTFKGELQQIVKNRDLSTHRSARGSLPGVLIIVVPSK